MMPNTTFDYKVPDSRQHCDVVKKRCIVICCKLHYAAKPACTHIYTHTYIRLIILCQMHLIVSRVTKVKMMNNIK